MTVDGDGAPRGSVEAGKQDELLSAPSTGPGVVCRYIHLVFWWVATVSCFFQEISCAGVQVEGSAGLRTGGWMHRKPVDVHSSLEFALPKSLCTTHRPRWRLTTGPRVGVSLSASPALPSCTRVQSPARHSTCKGFASVLFACAQLTTIVFAGKICLIWFSFGALLSCFVLSKLYPAFGEFHR